MQGIKVSSAAAAEFSNIRNNAWHCWRNNTTTEFGRQWPGEAMLFILDYKIESQRQDKKRPLLKMCELFGWQMW